jgi:hypothetical protein
MASKACNVGKENQLRPQNQTSGYLAFHHDVTADDGGTEYKLLDKKMKLKLRIK